MMYVCRFVLLVWCCMYLFIPQDLAADIKMPHPIILGQSCALTGPAKDLGLELRGGLLAAFSKVNDEGGVNGREIVLVSKDDGYEPDRAIRNTRELIKREHALMLIGEVGTPTSKAVVPIAEEYGIPFLRLSLERNCFDTRFENM